MPPTPSSSNYAIALRAGQKEYRACLARGEYPYLPVLDDILADIKDYKSVELGTIQIPAENIVGTRTAGRTTAFARNFMPLLPTDSEFGVKWEALCDAHLSEGIRDSVKVYEYLNRYYVQEGNKRVSVLKFFHAATVLATVTRIMPPKNDSYESKLYYEYVDFNKLSGINSIWCTRLGSYKRLQTLVGKKPQEEWSQEDVRAFERFYHYFCRSYESLGGKRLRTTTAADALLVFLKIYGYPRALEMSSQELTKSLTKIWEEVVLLREERPIELVLNPPYVKKKLLTKLTSTLTSTLTGSVGALETLNVAFVHDKTTQTSSWTYLHELGRRHVDQVLRGRVSTHSYFNALDGDPEALLEQVVQDGADLIFTTTPRLLNVSLKAAVDHPNVIIMNCSLNTSQKAIRTYYARVYEAKFIIGAIAGSLSQSNQIGYICDYPIYGVIAAINAFALGAQMVNPRAKIYLEWMNDDYGQAVERLRRRGVSLISGRDMSQPYSQHPGAFGLFFQREEDRFQTLATPIWHWGVYYENLIRSILDHTFQAEEVAKEKSTNYWWGMSAGVVDVICSEKLPVSTMRLSRLLRGAIQSGNFHPFDGVLKSQDGLVHGSEEDVSTPEEITTMDWLAENVVGELPAYRQLSQEGKATVDIVGVEKVAKQGQEEPEEAT